MFSRRKEEKVLNKDDLHTYIIGINNAQQISLIDQFKYITELQANLKAFGQKSSLFFITEKDERSKNTCLICLEPLLGPCSQYKCQCRAIIHESCMFRLILSGHNNCPQCNDNIHPDKYRPKIQYPKTLKMNSIRKGLDKILNSKPSKPININKVIEEVLSDNIKDNATLGVIYK